MANLILTLHFLYVLAVIIPVPLIIIGRIRGWRWGHNNTFRHIHLMMILIVVAESLLGLMCPLTLWEADLRGTQAPGSFIAHWLSQALYYDLPGWVFTAAYTAFGLLILGLYIIVPPQWLLDKRNRRRKEHGGEI